MPNMQAYEAFVALMEEYTDFLERMLADEKEKFDALRSRELPRIEHSIATSQANAKQLENYEAKRLAAQGEAGFAGLSFNELIAKAPEEDQNRLYALLGRFTRSVQEIQFKNDKSMALARDNMLEINPEAVLPGAVNAAPNPYAKRRDEEDAASTLLETKI